jgi:hypothetical protein
MSQCVTMSPERRTQALDDNRFHSMIGAVRSQINTMLDCDIKRYLEHVIKIDQPRKRRLTDSLWPSDLW